MLVSRPKPGVRPPAAPLAAHPPTAGWAIAIVAPWRSIGRRSSCRLPAGRPIRRVPNARGWWRAALEELLAGPVERVPRGRPSLRRRRWLARPRRPFVPAARTKLVKDFLFDECEPLARRRSATGSLTGLGAVIVGWPYSPLYYGAQRLVATGVPYVVDVGDPWALTAKKATAEWKRIPGARREAERFVWEHAAGGVVTTATQRDALRELFPRLALLCRPNGYFEVDGDRPPGAGDRAPGRRSCDSCSTARSTRFGCRSETGSSRLRAGGGLRPDQLRQLRVRRRARAPRVGRSRRGRGGPGADRVGRRLARRTRVRRRGRRRQQGPGAAAEQGDPVPDPADPAPGGDRWPARRRARRLRRRQARVHGGRRSTTPRDRPGARSSTCDGRGPPRSSRRPRGLVAGGRAAAWPEFASDRWQGPRGDRAEAGPAVGGRWDAQGTDVAERRPPARAHPGRQSRAGRWRRRASRAPDRRRARPGALRAHDLRHPLASGRGHLRARAEGAGRARRGGRALPWPPAPVDGRTCTPGGRSCGCCDRSTPTCCTRISTGRTGGARSSAAWPARRWSSPTSTRGRSRAGRCAASSTATWSSRRADAFIAVSNIDRRRMIEIERIDPAKVVVIPNGIPAPAAAQRPRPARRAGDRRPGHR